MFATIVMLQLQHLRVTKWWKCTRPPDLLYVSSAFSCGSWTDIRWERSVLEVRWILFYCFFQTQRFCPETTQKLHTWGFHLRYATYVRLHYLKSAKTSGCDWFDFSIVTYFWVKMNFEWEKIDGELDFNVPPWLLKLTAGWQTVLSFQSERHSGKQFLNKYYKDNLLFPLISFRIMTYV